jgi:hypothetical protein
MRKAGGFAGLMVVWLVGCGGSGKEAGSLAVDQPCRSTLDCAQGEGEPVECRCTDRAGVPVCDRLSGVNESCRITGSFQNKCSEGRPCVAPPNGDFSEAVCVEAATVGKPCASFVDCLPDLSCDAVSGCRAGTAATGEGCDADSDCAAPLRCASFSCTAPFAAGEACETLGPPTARTCAPGTGCAGWTNVCEPLKADGDDCFWDVECLSGVCFFDTCGKDAKIEGTVQCGAG